MFRVFWFFCSYFSNVRFSFCFFLLCMVTIVCRSYSSGLSRVSSLFYGKGELSWFFRIKKRLINATDRSFEKHEMLDCRCYWQHSHEVGRNVACVAWWFWLGALSNKGGRGQRNREEIGAEATWKTACTDGGLFWVGPHASVRIVPIGSECSPVNQIFW